VKLAAGGAVMQRTRLSICLAALSLLQPAFIAGCRRSCEEVATDYARAFEQAQTCDPAVIDECSNKRPIVVRRIPDGGIVDPRDEYLYKVIAIGDCDNAVSSSALPVLDRYLDEYRSEGCEFYLVPVCSGASQPAACSADSTGWICTMLLNP
jgi:hypothetical protein